MGRGHALSEVLRLRIVTYKDSRNNRPPRSTTTAISNRSHHSHTVTTACAAVAPRPVREAPRCWGKTLRKTQTTTRLHSTPFAMEVVTCHQPASGSWELIPPRCDASPQVMETFWKHRSEMDAFLLGDIVTCFVFVLALSALRLAVSSWMMVVSRRSWHPSTSHRWAPRRPECHDGVPSRAASAAPLKHRTQACST